VSLLTGKRAFVSGGTRGIGAALCEIFAREGADVVFNYGSRDDLAEEVRGKIESHGRQALSYKVSVTDRLGLKRIVKEIVGKWGGLDILINNAAINRPDSFATTTDHAWDEVINTNVGSLFAVTKPIYKQMIRQRKGSILNITSIAALRAVPTAVHYATSKAAIVGFTKCLSREAAMFGIRVNAIAAGVFDTDLAQILPQRVLELHNMWTPAGRVGRPEELAEYAAFMVSDRNTFMNGEVVVVDGGATT
jgi:3-oxoacyl-[acyl-carrier protein] reductase